MNEATARKILGSIVNVQDDGLFEFHSSTISYLSWQPHELVIELEGNLSIDQLEAITWWIKNKRKSPTYPCSED